MILAPGNGFIHSTHTLNQETTMSILSDVKDVELRFARRWMTP
jgi:hypothetical protein